MISIKEKPGRDCFIIARRIVPGYRIPAWYDSRMARPLVVGNWKLYVESLAEGKRLVRDIDRKLPRRLEATAVICPPVPFAAALRAGYGGKRLKFGAQDASDEVEGAHTGESSPRALAKSGIEYVILGHSELRARGETNEMVAKKAAAVLAERLVPIICVSERERDPNAVYLTEFAKDIAGSLARVEPSAASRIIIAYEPSWAIGGEEPPLPRAITEMTVFVRKTLAGMWGRDAAFRTRVIYGGSINTENAPALAKDAEIDGVLVGHHSVEADAFADIIRAFS